MTPVNVDTTRAGLQRLQRLLSARRSWAAVAGAAGIDVSQQAMQILLVLADGNARSIADVARAARMDAAAVSRQVRDLVARGLVSRRSSPPGGRTVLVEPTAAGSEIALRVRRLRDRHLADALAAWDPGERETLGQLLIRLVDDLERTPYRSTPEEFGP
jgi:DNA-binding MarR family transcriptional regulator